MMSETYEPSQPLLLTDDELLASAFEAIGIKSYIVRDKNEVLRILRREEDELPEIVFMNESVAEMISDYRERILQRRIFKPIFAVIPDLKKPRGLRLRELRDLIEKSLGFKGLKV
ncbi:MAG: hypothetical protein DRO00_00570 [Thermoproteota archaeon]|nr:MAG: hypothetical protein DRN92_00805 [Candidatus Korarchaeota archaeon]RLG49461.1 MAG: hypothetical protein DRN90_01640 [Candidatus Korarchaeota archaeon]RLG54717.1 MAG: hypothetical protein DRO00_00570 [Candidatus Korarchaeota archaeon]